MLCYTATAPGKTNGNPSKAGPVCPHPRRHQERACRLQTLTCKTRGRISDRTGACAMSSRITTPTDSTPATVVMGRLGRPSSPGAHPAPLLPELLVSTTCRAIYDEDHRKSMIASPD